MLMTIHLHPAELRILTVRRLSEGRGVSVKYPPDCEGVLGPQNKASYSIALHKILFSVTY